MQLRYNFRLYPTPGQCLALAKAFGCARVVFNDALSLRREAHAAGLAYIPDGDLSKIVITEAKKTPGRAWLGEVSAVVLQQALGRLRLPRIGDVPVRWSRHLPSDPSSVTVVKDAAGRYFASFVVKTDAEPLPEAASAIGIDLGLTHFAVLSDGRRIDNPRFLRRAERELRKAQQVLSRKAKGSSNRGKAAVRVARAHAKVADARRDHHHKLSTALIRDNQAVFVEDLAVNGLARTRLAKSVHDAGWAQFHEHAGVQGRPLRAHLREGGPVVPLIEGVQFLWRDRRVDAVEHPRVGLPVRRCP
ncbi:hypothetical protein GCM10010191_94920 [Actinomadura vinacea]|uniref:Transposase n=1 Tax=Actinomadura vinacea TaxID=115336 RepID=A0ABN3KGW9_9ACTN